MTYDGHVAIVELQRPPHNYFDLELIAGLADVYEALDEQYDCRAILLAAQGKAFCAGANHQESVAPNEQGQSPTRTVMDEAIRLFRTRKPVVAVVHGAAVGGGLGLALSADFRVTCPDARFWANFARLGFHAGFGLSWTLPRLVGGQNAATLLYTGRRIDGVEAVGIGLADVLAGTDDVRVQGMALAQEIASCAPLAVQSMRATLRKTFLAEVQAALEREKSEQQWQRKTRDCREGIRAMAERRAPQFQGR